MLAETGFWETILRIKRIITSINERAGRSQNEGIFLLKNKFFRNVLELNLLSNEFFALGINREYVSGIFQSTDFRIDYLQNAEKKTRENLADIFGLKQSSIESNCSITVLQNSSIT